MKFALLFTAGISALETAWNDVVGVFTTAKTALAAAPLPAAMKTSGEAVLDDSLAALQAAKGLAGTVAGEAASDGVTDITDLLVGTANSISGAKSLSQFSVAEKAVFAQIWGVMKAQGDTMLTQVMAGVDPTAAKPAAAPAVPPASA